MPFLRPEDDPDVQAFDTYVRDPKYVCPFAVQAAREGKIAYLKLPSLEDDGGFSTVEVLESGLEMIHNPEHPLVCFPQEPVDSHLNASILASRIFSLAFLLRDKISSTLTTQEVLDALSHHAYVSTPHILYRGTKLFVFAPSPLYARGETQSLDHPRYAPRFAVIFTREDDIGAVGSVALRRTEYLANARAYHAYHPETSFDLKTTYFGFPRSLYVNPPK